MSNNKKNNIMAWSGIASGGFGLISNLFSNNANRKAQESANRTNIKLAQMGNDFNEKMMNKQMSYNTEMWNKNNEYNDPSKQAARLRAAGLNPTLMMGQGGNSGSAAGGISPASANVARTDPARVDYSGAAGAIQSAIDSHAQRRLMQKQGQNLEEDTNKKRIDQMLDMAKVMQDVAESSARTDNWKIRNKMDNMKFKYAETLEQMNIDYLNTQIEQGRQNVRSTIINNAIQSKELANYDQNFQLKVSGALADITETYARIENLKANEQLTYKQIEQIDKHIKGELAQDILAIAQAEGVRISNGVARRTAENLVRQSDWQTYYSQFTPSSTILMQEGQLGFDKYLQDSVNKGKNFFNKYVVKPSKRAWKDTRRYVGF